MTFEEYRKRVFGCYVGKCVGGTLGMKYEGNLNFNEISYYDPVPDKMLPNDDLDLQVVNLETILRNGLPVSRLNVSEISKYHVSDTAPDEYGCSLSNINLKIFPPLSGYYRNEMYAGMGGAIRSELWACLAPTNPALAATFAREDACTDHAKEGIHAETFLAAVESAAFNQTDVIKLVDVGLSFIPENSKLKRAFTDVIKWWREEKDLLKVRKLILENYYSVNWTDVTINLSFILLSLLSSDGSFDKAITSAVSLGYDTDCTGATVGAIFGILNPDGIDKKWTDPIGNALVLSAGIINMHAANTVDDFCNQIISVADEVQKYYNTGVCLDLPKNFPKAKLAEPYLPSADGIHDWKDDSKEALLSTNPLIVSLIYPESVAALPNVENKYVLKIKNPYPQDLKAELFVNLPDYWTVSPVRADVELKAGDCVSVPLSIIVDGKQKRMPLNLVSFVFKINGMKFTVDAGLPVSYQWLVENLDDGKKTVFEAENIFFTVPEGRYKYTAKLFSPMKKEVKLYTGSLRKFKVFLDGKQIFNSTDTMCGTQYNPTFHRSGAYVIEIPRRDSVIDVVFEDGKPEKFFMGFSTIYGCAVWIDTFERRNFDLP